MTEPRSLPWLGTGWKMTKTRTEAEDYARDLSAAAPGFAGTLNTFVLPSYPHIDPVARILRGSGVLVGAQNVHWADQGAFTGEVSASMLVEIGATLVSVGHAERRAMFAETDDTVRARVAAALRHGLTALVCVGESIDERTSGSEVAFVARQLSVALSGVPAESVPSIMVAYEPVWAIGTDGTPASAEHADSMHTEIRRILIEMHGDAGGIVPLLYGGGVDEDNAADLIASPHVDGLFVGRAGWSLAGFLELASVVAAG